MDDRAVVQTLLDQPAATKKSSFININIECNDYCSWVSKSFKNHIFNSRYQDISLHSTSISSWIQLQLKWRMEMLSLTPGIEVDARVAADSILRAPVVVVEGALVQPPPALDIRHRKSNKQQTFVGLSVHILLCSCSLTRTVNHLLQVVWLIVHMDLSTH